MTNSWVDIRNANIILSMGGNSAEAHPVGFRWVMQAKERSDAILISIDPRYNRTTAVADYHAWIRTGTDIVIPRRADQLPDRERSLRPRIRAALHRCGAPGA